MNFPVCPLPALSRVWVYLRDSGGEGQDLASQRAYVLGYCDHHRLDVVRVFEDAAVSGGSIQGRDEFGLMLDLARHSDRPVVDGLLYWDMKRFARNQLDSQFYMADLRRRGYRLVSISDDIPDNEFSGVIEAFLQWKAQKDRDDISKDSKRGLAFIIGMKDENGRYLGLMPGRPPTFFKGERYDTGLTRNDGRPRIVQRLVPDEETWELGKRAWAMRAEGLGYREIEQELRLFGHVQYPGGVYSGIFRNEIYIGRLHYGGRIYEDFVPALATMDQWERVQAQRYKRVRGNSFASKAGKTDYLLSGLCRCFYCTSAMHGMKNTRRDRNTAWRFYLCSLKHGRRDQCISKQMSAERLERAVVDMVCNRVLTMDTVDELIEQVNMILADQNGAQREMERCLAELAEVEHAINNLLHMAEMTPSLTIARQLERRELERREIGERLRTAEAKTGQRSLEIDRGLVVEALAGYRGTLHNGTLRAQQLLLRRLVDRLEVSRDAVKIHYYVQLPTLVDFVPPRGFVINQCQVVSAAL